MTIHSQIPVVVGVDGSAASLDAVRVAAREAAERNRPLRVVHAFIWPLTRAPLAPAPGAPAGAGLRNQAERHVAEAVAEAGKVAPDVPVTGVVADGAPARMLVEKSKDSQLVVVGAHGRGALGGLLLGSVSHAVLHHAHSPLVIVRNVA
ncbi:Nucleotide-binding universal stress protein, UspA family [Micromonospora marina]|uniref:Nucleotide-binding universal stress protein, UspA family n=1 Tax=Micromonospora marina TaxID=307120 RepID=A0A1C4VKW6_9ACTN|nr:Nucleotide-binding universal stress protein, UspA family [Micromonospora marina]